MADGSVYSCSAYLLDDRFKLGNIYENTFKDVWCSNKKIEHAQFVKNELDINYKQASEKKTEFAAYYEDNNIGVLNFKDVKTSPYILSISLKNNEAEKYLIQNSDKFVASTGSACNAEVIEISHVLKAIGVADRQIIRISL